MMKYVSTRGGGSPVDFETAVLQGFADDGGLYVPESLPRISDETLSGWAELSFNELAFEILSLYIDRSIIPEQDLRELILNSTSTFSHPEVLPVRPIREKSNHFIMELFHGPTLSFKDIAMGFLINCMDYLLERRGESVSLLLATTGDTGPAAAYASQGKKHIDCWALYPRGFISEEQERQMTALAAANVHAVAVENCPDGGDDLDMVIGRMFEDKELVKKLGLSSVNSINWCRVLFQTIHYFYGYFQVVDKVGEKICFSVPTGGFGNLLGGYVAREMGLPVSEFICANNSNGAVHRILETGRLTKEKIKQTVSNAIDLILPYNYWRLLYFASGCNSDAVSRWMDEYSDRGAVSFEEEILARIRKGFFSVAVSDQDTLETMADTYQQTGGYLLDPHGAVAVAAVHQLKNSLPNSVKVISLLTAHPAKFPDITRRALHIEGELPEVSRHHSIEKVKNQFQRLQLCDCSQLQEVLTRGIKEVVAQKKRMQNRCISKPWSKKHKVVTVNTLYNLSNSFAEPLTSGELIKLSLERGDHQIVEEYQEHPLMYTPNGGSLDLREEIAALYGPDIKAENIVVFPGAQVALQVVADALLDSDSHTIVFAPGYQSLQSAPVHAGSEVTVIQLRPETGWQINVAEVEAAIQANTKYIVINEPNNPTGTLMSLQVQQHLKELAETHGIYILSDEVYRLLEHNPEERLPAMADLYQKGISVVTLSKPWGGCGVTIGWVALQNLTLKEKIIDTQYFGTACPARASEIQAIMALRASDTILARNRDIILHNLESLTKFMDEYDDFFEWIKPKAGAIAYIKFKGPLSSEEFGSQLAARGISIKPAYVFSDFGTADSGYFRVGYGEKSMQKAVEALTEFVEDQKKNWM